MARLCSPAIVLVKAGSEVGQYPDDASKDLEFGCQLIGLDDGGAGSLAPWRLSACLRR
jgi:hypothetical protein